MFQTILQTLSGSSVALNPLELFGMLAGTFVLGWMILPASLKIRHGGKNVWPKHFCRWKGMHVPCFDVLSTLADGVVVTDHTGKIVFINPAAENLLGRKSAEAVGKHYSGIVRLTEDQDPEKTFDPFEEARKTRTAVSVKRDFRILSPDGTSWKNADRVQAIFRTEAAEPHLILVIHDATTDYELRDTLRTTLRQMELGAEMTSSATFLIDPVTREISGSKLLNQLWPIRDGFAVPPEEWIVPEDRMNVKNIWDSVASGSSEAKSCVFRTNGTHHYRISMISDRHDPRKIRISGVIQDISEIHDNAAKLKAFHELWTQIINSIPTMFFAKDPDNHFRYKLCNQSFAAFLGKTPQEVIGKTDAELNCGSKEIAGTGEQDSTIMKSGHDARYMETVWDSRGETHFLSIFKRPIRGIDNQNLLLGVCMDITEIHNLLQYEQVNNEALTCAVSEDKFIPLIERIMNVMLKCLKCGRVAFASLGQDGKLHCLRYVSSERNKTLETADDVRKHEKLWNRHLPSFRKGDFLLYENFSEIPGSSDFLKDEPDYPTHSAAGVPVFLGEELFGVLFIAFPEKHRFTELDKQILLAMSNIITLAQIRERQNRAVRLAEHHNQTILDNLDIPVWLYDPEGFVVRNNRAAAEMLKEKNIGHIPFDCRDKLVCGVDEEHCPVRRCVVTGLEQECNDRLIDNKEFIVKARPIFDENGKLQNIVKSYIDITSLQRMIGNQKLVNECLANLLKEKEIIPALRRSVESICRHTGADRCFIIQFFPERKTLSTLLEYSRSGESSELAGYQEESYADTPQWEEYFRETPNLAIPEVRSDETMKKLGRWKSMIERYDIRSFYARRINFDGKLWGYIGFCYEKKPKVLDQGDMSLLGAVAYCVELTLDRRKNQEDILAALEKAEAADRAKSIFLASMSHEIRTPLNAVIGFSELLKDGNLPEKDQRAYLRNIFSAGNSLLALINDVLDLSKLEAGQMEFSASPVSLRDMMLDVGGIFRGKCFEKKLYLTFDLPEDLPVLWLDKLRVRQILFNLIGNAVKFTDRGGITVRAEFRRETETLGSLTFHVVDTGCGISDEDKKRVFQMFVQATALRGTQAASGGTGLGLAICKRMTEQMNGAIGLESTPGKGSDFFVTLHGIRYETQSAERTLEAESEYSAPKSSGKRVLLVDDVPMNLQVMTAMLGKLGAESVSVNRGEDVMKLLDAEKFDFLLTDLWMPGMNGADLAAEIRRRWGPGKIPVYAITADIEAKANFPLEDFAGILLKPITIEKLQRLLSGLEKGSGKES